MLLLLLATALPARADETVHRAVIVLDRGAAAQEDAATAAGNALRIWRALEARGVDARLLACGVDAEGAPVVEPVTPSRAGVAGLAETAPFSFAGPTDPRLALAAALDLGGETPVDIILVGPFGPVAQGKEAKDAPGQAALARWNEEAADGSRVIAVRTAPAALERLQGARGLVAQGLLVVAFETPEVQAGGFSALQEDDADAGRMEARVRILADVLGLAPADKPQEVLAARSDVPDDKIEGGTTAGLHTWLLRRRARDGRTATLTFQRVASGSTTWLCEPPQPLTFRWDRVLVEAALRDADGTPARAFAAIDVESDAPRTMTYRLVRARTGPAPAWSVTAQTGELPPGLAVEVGREIEISPEIGASEVRVTYTATRGRPVEVTGTLLLSAEGIDPPLPLPYEIRVQPGRARLEAETEIALLPRAQADALTVLRLVAENANAPSSVQLTATCSAGQETWLRAVLLDDAGGRVRWSLEQPLVLDVGASRRVAFELEDSAPMELPWPCTVTIRPVAVEGVTVEGEALLTVRKRRPRLDLVAEPPRFRLQDGALVSDGAILLQLAPDGGDGDWLLDLHGTPPIVRSLGAAPIGWQVVGKGAGSWQIVPTGTWSGPSPSIFTPSELEVEVQILWDRGRTPGSIRVPVEIAPRWGARGFVILTLAVLALVLAVLVGGYMRTPAVSGTLLYTVEGVAGTVGRLDLGAVGRRARAITSDEAGRLEVAGTGESIGRVRPTRVGGMLEYVDVRGSKERRLLVDGVSLRIGRHLVRYLSKRAQDARAAGAPQGEDLLGPEFDIESGRIDALGDEGS